MAKGVVRISPEGAAPLPETSKINRAEKRPDKEGAVTKMAKQQIEFPSNGITLHGSLYEPANNDQKACIVMARGLGTGNESLLDDHTECFLLAGYTVIVLDYCCPSAKGKLEAWTGIIEKQQEDWHAAIRYARTLPGIDPSKVTLWVAPCQRSVA